MRVLVSVVLILGLGVAAERPLTSFIKDRSSKPMASGRFAPALQSKFARFCEHRNRMYKNATELERHMAAFEKFQKLASDNQKRERGTARHGETIFADLTKEEFVRTRTGARLPPPRTNITSTYAPSGTIREKNSRSKRDIPTCFDYRKQGVVGPVKDQGGCGNCYAFASLGVLESVYSMKFGLRDSEVPDYSEAEITDCLYEPSTQSFGCNGGYADAVFEYVRDSPGVTSEDWYPFYWNVDHTQCYLYDSDPKYVVAPRALTQIISPWPSRLNETEMLQRLYDLGPFYVAIDSSALMTYESGILDPEEPADGWNVDHAVIVIGHCNDCESGMPHWIIKNSWGEDWGEDGYFRLRSGTNALDITSDPVWISFD